MSTHARFSPSAAERWVNCPGSVRLCERVPPSPDTPWSIEGTQAHAVLEAYMRAWLAGAELPEPKAPTEMVGYAWGAFERATEGLTLDVEVHAERKVRLDFIDPEFYGTLDLSFVRLFDTLEIRDFKYGSGVRVEPEENLQLIAYALAVAHEYDYAFGRVVLSVDQPRIPDPMGPVRSWSITIAELRRYEREFRFAIREARKPEPRLAAGEHCKWCPARAICPELPRAGLKRAQVDFEALPVTEEQLPAPREIADIGEALHAARLLEHWVSGVRQYAYAEVARGRSVSGWKLVAGRAGHRKWRRPEDAARLFKRHVGGAAFTAPELLSPAKLETLKLPGPKRKLVKRLVASLSERGQAKATLVPTDDPREELSGNTRTLFEALPVDGLGALE